MHDVYQKKTEHPRVSLTSHDHDLTSHDLFGPWTSRIDSTIITKIIGVLHINRKQYYNENMSRQLRGEMTDLRPTLIDL